jgi:haloalkane dehalogenase
VILGDVDTVRTPQDRFGGLDGFPYPPHAVTLAGGIRMGYVEDGPQDAPTVVLVHGEPTWGYLYRNVVPVLVDAGLHVVVPDLVGFGRSDKPTRRSDYSYAGHVEWLREGLFDALGLTRLHYVGQDWGGLLGMRLLAEHPERFASVVMANTGLPTGDVPMPEAWQRFRAMVEHAERLDIGRMVDAGWCPTPLTTLPPRPTGQPGNGWPPSTSRSSAPSATETPSPGAATAGCVRGSPGPRTSRT